jgi:molybdate transport system regulatory protein
MRKAKTLELADALGGGSTDKRIEILRRVQAVGSISQAARDAGVSYKAAWQALDTLSNLAGLPLVERAVGGTGGGGAVVTEAGQRVLAAADALALARDQVLARFGRAAVNEAMGALALRTSMRNQLPCTVRALRGHAGAIEAEVALTGGALRARITRESAQLLGLVPGLDVLALCKATAVDILRTAPPRDTRNLLHGVVVRASRAAGGGECALELPGGLRVVGFSGPGLRAGMQAVACVDASAVVLALAG